ncbi:TetR/AcrR family transcriptional regulator [Nocardia rhizosphaerae]|uniref:TetR/AcrR family transcriptional regulator n=1 Tax=Nocardia rhizosphaerae TaxID=1691571 RepID=A0ABV8L317_9NOCA
MAARDGLVQSAIDLVRRRGVAGTGVAQLLEHSGLSRRTIYLNFPGGKSELIAEATRVSGRATTTLIETFGRGGTTEATINAFADTWKQIVESSGFLAGCPIVAAALGRLEAPAAADAAGAAFTEWEQALESRLRAEHIAPDTAKSLATTVIATIEGAVVMSLAKQSTEPLEHAGLHLSELIRANARPQDDTAAQP